MRKGTWEELLQKAAIEAARERVKYNVKNKYGRSDGDEKKYFEKYLRQLEKELPYETASNEDIELVTGFGAEPLFKWFDFGGISPRDNAKRIEASKILPYLTGVAKEGEDWMSLPRGKMDELAVSMGFKPGDPAERGAFYDKIRQYQTDLDRARIVKEMQDTPEHLAMSLVYPSLTEGIDNAVATGGDLSPAQAVGLGALDLGINGAMMSIPGLRTGFGRKGALDNVFHGSKAIFEFNNLTSKDIINAVLQGGSQGLAEMGRQIAKGVIDDELEGSYVAAPLAAATLGATTPAIVGTVSTGLSKFGPAAREYARGINKTVRSMDPMLVERQKLANTVSKYNALQDKVTEDKKWFDVAKELRDYALKNAGDEATVPNLDFYKSAVSTAPYPLSKSKDILRTQDFPTTAEIIKRNPGPDGKYSAIDILNAYDREPVQFLELSTDGKYKAVDRITEGNSPLALGPSNEQAYAQAFPARYADLLERTPNIEKGIAVGNFLQDIGSRIEPTIKGTVNAISPPSYKDAPWYKKLDPERRRIIDEAYKKKQEEE